MADNSVFITGIASGAYDDLPPWATEDTAHSIEQILTKELGFQSKALTSLLNELSKQSSSDSPASNDELEEHLNNLRDENNQYNKRRQFWRDEDTREKKRKESADDQVKEIYRNSLMLQHLYTAGLEIKQAMIDNVNVYDQLIASGTNMLDGFDAAVDGFDALSKLAFQTGIRFTELNETMQRYSTAVNTFGAEKFAKTISEASSALTRFGFTSRESADLLGAYLESQRAFSNVNSLTQKQVQSDLVKFGSTITKMSLASGMAREKLMANVQALSESVEMTLLATQIGHQGATATRNFLASFKDQSVAQSLLGMMTDVIKPLNNTFMDFQKVGFGAFGQKFMAFTESLKGMSGPEAQKAMAEFTKRNELELNRMQHRAKILEQSGLREATAVSKHIVSLKQHAKAYNEISEEDRERQEKTSESSRKFNNAVERLRSSWQALFPPMSGFIDIMTWGVEVANSLITGFANGVKYVDGWINGLNIFDEKIRLLPIAGLLAALTTTSGALYAFKIALAVRGKAVAAFGTSLSFAGKWIKTIGSLFWKFGKFFIRFLGPIGLLITGFQILSQFEWFNKMVDSIIGFFGEVFSSLPSVVKKFFGIDKEENTKTASNHPRRDWSAGPGGTLAPSRPPKETVVQSPAIVSPSSGESVKKGGKSADVLNTQLSANSTTSTSDNEISNLLQGVNAHLEKLVSASEKTVSIGSDQLRYTKAAS